MKNSKKAFTLVELLVVIAILAVLASVSIIGYTAFTKKAVENNAVSELTQVKTLVTGGATTDENGFVVYLEKTDPQVGGYAYRFTFDSEHNVYTLLELTIVAESVEDSALTETQVKASGIELKITDEAKFSGAFSIDGQKVKYTLTNGGNTAVVAWDLTTGEVK